MVTSNSVTPDQLSSDIKRDSQLTPSTVAKAHETQHPQQKCNCLCADIFDSTDVDCLTVVAQPVSEVNLGYQFSAGEILTRLTLFTSSLENFLPLIAWADAKVRRTSSISPWRQLTPSTAETEPMLPAPNACVGRANRTIPMTQRVN